jgi:hypothetical protein
MKLSQERINELKKLLKEQFDLEYTDEQAQEAGLAIMRFVVAKEQQKNTKSRGNDGNTKS